MHDLPQRNIELKARRGDLKSAEAAALTLDVRDGGVQRQIDTYFTCHHGRLKLREIVDVRAELIWYERSNEAKARASDYRLTEVQDPGALRAALSAALGVCGEVRKRRRVLLWHNVRIHLDEVEGLGSFVEFEAVMGAGEDESTAHARIAELCRAMGIRRDDWLKESYADLRLQR